MPQIHLNEDLPSMRLDQALSRAFPDYSRAQLQSLIKAGQVQVNGKTITKQRHTVKPGDELAFGEQLTRDEQWLAEDIPLNIIYEDDALLIVNKSSPMVTHPGAGVYEGTLVNALLHHCPDLQSLPRAGLIHRLDKETTGLLVVAKTPVAHKNLSEQMQNREIHRIYQAIVQGPLVAGGSVNAPIGRHPIFRTKMAVLKNAGREAITHYRILSRFQHHTYLQLQLETGRTHQIRVHMSHIRHPIVGDPAYSKLKIPRDCSEKLAHALQYFKRQALHAAQLELIHPTDQKPMHFKAPLPEDFQQLLEALIDNESR